MLQLPPVAHLEMGGVQHFGCGVSGLRLGLNPKAARPKPSTPRRAEVGRHGEQLPSEGVIDEVEAHCKPVLLASLRLNKL